MQRVEILGGGDRAPVVEPACLHQAGPVARVAAHQERITFYHRAGWTEGYFNKEKGGSGN